MSIVVLVSYKRYSGVMWSLNTWKYKTDVCLYQFFCINREEKKKNVDSIVLCVYIYYDCHLASNAWRISSVGMFAFLLWCGHALWTMHIVLGLTVYLLWSITYYLYFLFVLLAFLFSSLFLFQIHIIFILYNLYYFIFSCFY